MQCKTSDKRGTESEGGYKFLQFFSFGNHLVLSLSLFFFFIRFFFFVMVLSIVGTTAVIVAVSSAAAAGLVKATETLAATQHFPKNLFAAICNCNCLLKNE